MDKILHGDSLELLKDLDDNSVDSIVTDPPYGYDFMGKDWDKAVPSVEMWEECLRVLKPGSFAFIMSAPRADVQGEMIKRLEKAGFRVDFTPVYWTYATGFPKATNISKMVDKRLGVKGKVVGKKKNKLDFNAGKKGDKGFYETVWDSGSNIDLDITTPSSDEAKELNGSYAGYQPKPAVEVVIVVMKPLSEKSYIDQAMKNGKGVTWLDDARIPFTSEGDYPGWWKSGAKGSDGYLGTDTFKIRDMSAEEIKNRQFKKTTKRKPREENTVFKTSGFKSENNDTAEASPLGRFAANLLVQDDILNDGKNRKSIEHTVNNNNPKENSLYDGGFNPTTNSPTYSDEGSFSRYYDLDSWWESRIQELPLDVQATYPFLIVPKASKSEKNKGCEGMEEKYQVNAEYRPNHMEKALEGHGGKPHGRFSKVKNNHPTVKPISLMSYLVTLGSREDDLVLDPFVGSGTTCIAAKLLSRKYIGMEMDDEYVVIAQERIKAHKPEVKKHDFF